MTLLEKIKKLTWFNLVELLQDILLGFDRKIKVLEEKPSSGGGGGSQDLQSVLTQGNTSSVNINIENATQFARLSPNSISLSVDDMGTVSEGELGATQLKFTSDLGYTNILYPNTASTSSFYFPEKTGDYTLATLDDLSPSDLQNVLTVGSISDKDITLKANLLGISSFTSFGYTGLTTYGVQEEAYINRADYLSGSFTISDYITQKTVSLYPNTLTFAGATNFSLRITPTLGGGNGILSIPNIGADTRTLPISVNGVFADVNGNISIAGIGTVAPASATATGTVGEIRVAAGFIYWCTAPNTWIRAAGVTW